MESQIVYQAKFNERIKKYILVTVGIIFLISLVGLPILIIWLLGLGQYISKRYYDNLQCTLTTQHLEYKKGVLFKVEKTIPLENIQDLTFIQNPILNYFGLKILKIETAGNSGAGSADMKLVGIEEIENFKKLVLIQREKLKQSNSSSNSMSSSLENENLLVLKEIRDLLKKLNEK